MRKCRKKLFEQILFVFENICDRLLKKAMKAKKNQNLINLYQSFGVYRAQRAKGNTHTKSIFSFYKR